MIHEIYGKLPEFASHENKILDQNVRDKELILKKTIYELEDNLSRTESLHLHLKNVCNQEIQLQTLQEAKKREIKLEFHLKEVSERESGRLKQEISTLQKQEQDYLEQTQRAQNSIFQINEKIANLRNQINVENDELDDWLKVQREKEEDNMIILKYTKEDDHRIKEMSLDIEKNLKHVFLKNKELNDQMTEAKITQHEVDRASDEFRKLHLERKDLLFQWESTLNSLKKRDAQISDSANEYQKTLEKIDGISKEIDEQKKILFEQTQVKLTSQRQIEEHDRQYLESQNKSQDDYDTMKKHLHRISQEIDEQKQQIQHLEQKKQNLIQKIDSKNEKSLDLEQKIKQVLEDTGSKEQKAYLLQEHLHQDELRIKELDKMIKQCKDQAYKYTKDLTKLKEQQKTTEAEIIGAQANLKNLSARITKLDQDSIHQRTLIYNQEYALQQVERKLRRAQGERTAEEKTELTKKINDLNSKLALVTESYQILQTQLKKAQDDLRHSDRRLEKLQRQKQEISEQIECINLYSSSAASQLAAKIKDKEELLVEESILRLELRKLRSLVNSRSENVYSLESRQVQLQLALEERTNEINMHKSMLLMQIRVAEDERSSFAQELREKVQKVQRMKTRYEILISQIGAAGMDEENETIQGLRRRKVLDRDLESQKHTFGRESYSPAPPQNEFNEEKTQTYYIIRAAQQREELQREANLLDSRIKKAEREIEAMQNSLLELNDKNIQFKKNLQINGLNPEDLEHKKHLQTQLTKAKQNLENRQGQMRQIQQQIMMLETEITNLTNEESKKQHYISHVLEKQDQDISKQVNDHQLRLKRVEQSIKKSKKNQTEEEEDVKVRECRESFTMLLSNLEEIAQRSGQTMELHRAFELCGVDFKIPLPKRIQD